MKTLKLLAAPTLLIAGVASIAVFMHLRAQNDAPPLPTFSFHAEKAAGWEASRNVNVQAVAKSTEYTGKEPIDKLPVADLTVHHGTSSSHIPDDACFLIYSYYDRPLSDVASAYKEYVDRKKQNGAVEEFAPTSQTVATFEGDKTYELRSYRYVIEGQDALQGYEIGFVPFEAGYIRIEGVCKTYEHLALTLPVLESVELLDH